MTSLLIAETRAIARYIRGNYRELVVVLSATLFLTLHDYHTIGNTLLSSLIYYVALPLLVIVILLRRNPLDFGLRLGNGRVWGFYTLVTCLLSIPLLYFASRSQALYGYYTMEELNLPAYMLETIFGLLAAEFLLRGFLLFGLKDKLKESSILLQMVPFVLLHFGKPEIETISTLLTGIYFGYVAYRGNSYWPAFIIHVFINISFIVYVNYF